MYKAIDHNEVEAALHRSGSTWSAAQAHGLLCSRLAVLGEDGGADWLGQVLHEFDSGNVTHGEGVELMEHPKCGRTCRSFRVLHYKSCEPEGYANSISVGHCRVAHEARQGRRPVSE